MERNHRYAQWTYELKESEIRRLLRFNPPYYFAGGKPGALPLKIMSSILEEIISEELSEKNEIGSTLALDYGPSEGIPELRQVLGERLRLRDGISLTKGEEFKEVIITTGSQQAVYGVLDAMINPGDSIIIPRPVYLGFLGIAVKLGANIVSIPTDDGGIIPEGIARAFELLEKERKKAPKLIYTIPFSDNPKGSTLSLRRKKEIFNLAEQWDALLIEDAAYKEIRYGHAREKPLDPMKKLDKENRRVAYINSSSKEAAVLRIGYSVVPPSLGERIIKAKGYYDLCTPSITQKIALYYYRDHIDHALPKIVGAYEERALAMKRAVDTFLEGSRTDPEGGFFVWFASENEKLDTAKLLTEALEAGVLYVPGAAFYPNTGVALNQDLSRFVPSMTKTNEIRLSYSTSKPEDITKGIEILGNLLALKS